MMGRTKHDRGRRSIIRPGRVVVASLAILTLTAGGAYAYFTATGSGSGAASTASMQTVTVSALVGGDVPSSALYPGGTADVVLRVNNPNTFSVSVTSVAGNGAITADAGHAGCTTTGVTYTPPASPSITLPAGSSVVHLAGAASMSAASLSACQGATFSIPITLTVRR